MWDLSQFSFYCEYIFGRDARIPQLHLKEHKVFYKALFFYIKSLLLVNDNILYENSITLFHVICNQKYFLAKKGYHFALQFW